MSPIGSFSDRLRDETLVLHHRTLSDLCSWADGVRGCMGPQSHASQASQASQQDRSLEQTIEIAFDVVLRKVTEMGILPTVDAVDYVDAVDAEAATVSNEYRNGNDGNGGKGAERKTPASYIFDNPLKRPIMAPADRKPPLNIYDVPFDPANLGMEPACTQKKDLSFFDAIKTPVGMNAAVDGLQPAPVSRSAPFVATHPTSVASPALAAAFAVDVFRAPTPVDTRDAAVDSPTTDDHDDLAERLRKLVADVELETRYRSSVPE